MTRETLPTLACADTDPKELTQRLQFLETRNLELELVEQEMRGVLLELRVHQAELRAQNTELKVHPYGAGVLEPKIQKPVRS